MKRRNFLQLLGLVPVAPLAVASSQDGCVEWPFRKEGALRGDVSADLSVVALEDAIGMLIKDAKVLALAGYVVVVPPWYLIGVAERVVAFIDDLRAKLPPGAFLPSVTYRIESTFTYYDEWGVVASNGRCWYSPGA